MANGRLAWDFKGLVTAPGLLARDGASCLIADNWRFPAPGIARKREGFERKLELRSQVVDHLSSIPLFGQGYVYTLGNDTENIGDTSDNTNALVANITAGTYSNQYVNNYSAVGRSMFSLGSSAALGGAFYSVDRHGRVLRTARYAGSRYTDSAGVAHAKQPYLSTLTAGTMLPNNASRAYRVTWHMKILGGTTGADLEITLGNAPSGRYVARNIAGTTGFSGATSDVELLIPVPYEYGKNTRIGTYTFWRLWASRIETSATGTPDDEMYLVNEAFLTTGATLVSVVDNTPDVYLEAQPKLHTNATNFPALDIGLLNGQANADAIPPACRCLAVFADSMFYGSPLFRPQANHRLTTLPVANDWVEITRYAYSGGVYGPQTPVRFTAVAGAPSANQFQIVSGLATLSLNLEATVRNMVEAINADSTLKEFTASSTSLGNDAQGAFTIESQGASFYLTASSAGVAALFSPAIPNDSVAITPSLVSNAVVFSKQNRPEAVPPINEIRFGSDSNTVRALVPFRERLLVWTDEGLYAVDGSSFADFAVTAVDLTARIIAPRSAVSLGDRAFAWCLDGVVQYRDGAIGRISEPISPTIRTILEVSAGDGSTFAGVSKGFAVADPRNSEVQFWYGTNATQPRCWKWLAWNVKTETWATGQLYADASGSWMTNGVSLYDSGRVLLLSATEVSGGSVTVPPALMLQRLGHSGGTPVAAQFQDASALNGGTARAVSSSLQLQWALADADARVHWQRTVLEFEDGEQAFLLKPTALSLVWRADAQSAASSVIALAPTTPLVEAEVPDGYRRATRSQLTVAHATAEPCGLIAVKQTFAESGSRFPG